jgi:8-oxo-dGTP pyrophosphatase MutT (NUDIX family)
MSPTDRFVQAAYWVAYRLHLLWAFLFRPECHGVWVAVWAGGELLLIRNGYRTAITLPGGGIDGSESPRLAATRELREEVGIRVLPEQLTFRGQYLSRCEFKRDHINLFELELADPPDIRLDNREVVWARMCHPVQARQLKLFPVLRTYLEERSGG